MPGMSGVELIRQINEKFSHMNVLFVSGYAEASRADINPGCIRLAKPFNQDQLAAAISQTLVNASRPIVA
jgi:two-component SAPR family response regulator